MKENKLIKFESGDLKRVGTAIAITNKILQLSVLQDSNFYFKRGKKHAELKNFTEAVKDFTRSIEIKSNDIVYQARGLAKQHLEDYLGAIEDHSRAIELNPSYDSTHYQNRAIGKNKIKDYIGAIDDFSKAIEIEIEIQEEINDDLYVAYLYYNRGVAKLNFDVDGACTDWKKSIEAAADCLDSIKMLEKYNR